MEVTPTAVRKAVRNRRRQVAPWGFWAAGADNKVLPRLLEAGRERGTPTLEVVMQINVTPGTLARFWAKVDKASSPYGCWLWTSAITASGRPIFWLGHPVRNIKAHRLAWLLLRGAIPEHADLAHDCVGCGAPADNPLCVNPDHMRPLDRATHRAETTAKGQNPAGQDNGNYGGGWRGGTRLHGVGERNGRARLTEAQARAILAAAQGTTIASLAHQYGVSAGTVASLVKRRTWRHLG